MRFGVSLVRPAGLCRILLLAFILSTSQLVEAKIVHKIVRNIAIPVIAGAGAGLAGGVVAGVVTGSHKNQYHPVSSASAYYAYRHSYSHRPPILQSLRRVLRYSFEHRRSAYRLAHPAVYNYKEEPHVECKVITQHAEDSDIPEIQQEEDEEEVHDVSSHDLHNEQAENLDKHKESHLSNDSEYERTDEPGDSDRDFFKRKQSRKLRRADKSRKNKAVRKKLES